jgi:hypothetical protein
LIVCSAVVLWRLYGGAAERKWVACALAFSFGPVWAQTVGGQYAGLMLLGVVGFLVMHRVQRPMLAGAFVALTALKPHLFSLVAIGLIIDAVRTPFGRRIVLGGFIALVAATVLVTIVNPDVWLAYTTATTGSGTRYSPGLTEWFNPTVQAWVRHAIPGRPFWVQFVPFAVIVPLFSVYWWRHGSPDRWPTALPWILPACLLIAPYGSWPTDLVLFLVPVTAIAARISRSSLSLARLRTVLIVYVVANVAIVGMLGTQAELQYYVWAAPVFVACLLQAALVLGADRQGMPAGPALVR